YPYGQDSLDPIFPKGSVFEKAGLALKVPANADSVYFNYKTTIDPRDSAMKPDPDNGSNNWAVHGSVTVSGRPILCNDPHLSLNLPSLWFEMQISTPAFNSYGVSFPGAPSIIIGFNNDIAFGFTNAMRDVRDYYEIKFRDNTHEEYWYNGNWQKTAFRKEVIKIKGQPDHIEKLAMTVWGPVMYDKEYPDKLNTNKAYAVHWKAHDGTNELKTFNQLNHAKNYNDYIEAISNFKCPGQNMIFASKSGDIAIKQQGEFPAKWRRQGDFVMPGDDSSYAWQGNIPKPENLVMLNPERGFVSSANQYPYDTSYPYYLGGSYPPYRGMQINRKLSVIDKVTPADMQALQTDNYNVFAEMARPVMLKYLDTSKLNNEEKQYLGQVQQWNLRNDPGETGPSIFTTWWDSLMVAVYIDDLHRSKLPLPLPEQSTLLESMLKDSAYEFADDINTPQKETLHDDVLSGFKKALPALREAEKKNKLTWGLFKDAGVKHLLSIPALSRLHLITGGGVHVINATKQFHGPSWRMVVHLTDEVEAYGVYPGGQSGNPGSKYYDNFVDTWAAGKYYRLKFYNQQEASKMKGAGKIVFSGTK
ncbi:MAG: penicillin acylase, partial [Chitinophagaceae bacterium]|nr:penicillin acylase [Chitinophagaceae bacterium]